MKKKILGVFLCLCIMVGLGIGINFKNLAYAQTPTFDKPNGDYGKNIYLTNYDNYVFVADTENNRIQIVDTNTMLAYNFGRGGILAESTTNPTLLACDNQLIYVCMANNDFIKVFDYNGNYKEIFYDSYTENTEQKMFNNIISMQLDTYGNLYLLHIDSENNTNLLKKINENFEIVQIDGLEFDSTSRLVISPDTQFLFVVNHNKIVKIDALTYEIIDNYDIDLTFDDLRIDYLNNLYFYQKDTNTLVKLLHTDYQTSSSQQIQSLTKSNGFCFDIISGKSFFVDDETNTLKQIEVDLIDSLKDFKKPTEYLQNELLNHQITIAKIIDETITYNYPYAISSNITLQANDFVIVLDNSQDFYYCLITNKKSYNLTVYIHKNHLQNIDLEQYSVQNGNFIISTPTAKVYKYPSSLNASQDIITPIALDTPLNSGAKVVVTKYLNIFKDSLGYSFYEISLENDQIAYIASASIITYNTQKDSKTIKANATIKITDERDFVNLYTKDGTLITTQVLMDGTRVRLVNNYNKNASLTEIKYIDNDGNVKTAFVKTKYIAMDGITFEIVIAIIMVVVCIILGLILFVIIKKSKNKV